MAKKTRAPWDRSNPRKRAGKSSKHLTSAEKAHAKARAKRAGRHYPNLVDNMHEAAKKKKSAKSGRKTSKAASTKKTAKRSAKSRKTTSKKQSRKRKAKKTSRKKSAERDPRGGLTAAGREAFARKQGAHLRPGVTKRDSDMSPMDMRRKGSWAVRFYGREKLPPLVDSKGRPTRLALSAHAWGEPVPRTLGAARRIAAKGRRLLARYHQVKSKT